MRRIVLSIAVVLSALVLFAGCATARGAGNVGPSGIGNPQGADSAVVTGAREPREPRFQERSAVRSDRAERASISRFDRCNPRFCDPSF